AVVCSSLHPSSSCFSIFYFYSSAPPRSLPSFPTRRSSDLINLDSIITADRDRVAQHITQSGKEIIAIDYEQMEHFAGNMLQVPAKNGQMHLIMSTQAWHSLSPAQQERLQSYNPVIHSDLSIIEQN